LFAFDKEFDAGYSPTAPRPKPKANSRSTHYVVGTAGLLSKKLKTG